MREGLARFLENHSVSVSAPCRIDMGGTLDISTFYLPLREFSPCTFNIAVDLRTVVRLYPYEDGVIKVSSRGFQTAEFPLHTAPFRHPVGLMFAVASYFNAHGVHVHIESASPPKGALGGSSAAAVALVAAFSRVLTLKENLRPLTRAQVALLAHAIEAGVAGVPCGLQDQLAAAYGGIHAWHWPADIRGTPFRKKSLLPAKKFKKIEDCLLLAYCGVPHESKDINGRWVEQFLSGKFRDIWVRIIACTQAFIEAVGSMNVREAVRALNTELALRRKMTADVLDPMGVALVDLALENNCGSRFAGAGGGGCIWALGEKEDIQRLRPGWEKALLKRKAAGLLELKVARQGVLLMREI
ncbi:MAG: galactokinase [Desulfobacterales bacterium]|nr:galactokinase [Desulfobacterales bacterium]